VGDSSAGGEYPLPVLPGAAFVPADDHAFGLHLGFHNDHGPVCRVSAEGPLTCTNSVGFTGFEATTSSSRMGDAIG
jgi:hypothetical protein